MNELDILYQRAVNEQAAALSELSKFSIASFPETGEFIAHIKGEKVIGSWNKYYLSDNKSHIIFFLTRRALLIAYKKYLSGVNIDSTELTSLLSDEEVSIYD